MIGIHCGSRAPHDSPVTTIKARAMTSISAILDVLVMQAARFLLCWLNVFEIDACPSSYYSVELWTDASPP